MSIFIRTKQNTKSQTLFLFTVIAQLMEVWVTLVKWVIYGQSIFIFYTEFHFVLFFSLRVLFEVLTLIFYLISPLKYEKSYLSTVYKHLSGWGTNSLS